jgi:CRISPR-associated protein Cmr5
MSANDPVDSTDRKTRDQERAAAAWASTPENPSDEYLSLVQGAGASIMSMGLGQTLAFYNSKGKEHHRRLGKALAAWLLEEESSGEGTPNGKDLLERITETDSTQYSRWTTEALAYLTWLKRFARANSID